MYKNTNIRCYVWDDITDVEYVSIIDSDGKEIIYPRTAKTEKIVADMEEANLNINNKNYHCKIRRR